MRNDMIKYFEIDPDAPPPPPNGPLPPSVERDYRSCVRFNNPYRFNKAKEQAALLPVDVDAIISYVNSFLEAIGMCAVENPTMDNPQNIDYEKIMDDYELKDERDIVWMKFTKDGYLGVVATSNDINFDIPVSSSEYNEREIDGWKRNSTGILIHKLGKEWDTSFVLVFPLINIPAGYSRSNIETGIGNYLIGKGVPILDYYSHNIKKRGIPIDSVEEIIDMEIVDDVYFDWFPDAKTDSEFEDEMDCWDCDD